MRRIAVSLAEMHSRDAAILIVFSARFAVSNNRLICTLLARDILLIRKKDIIM